MESEPLAKACALAFVVAREGVEAVPPIEPPAAMRSFLYVAQLPRRAITVAQRVIDEDPEFRARVAAQATEAEVGTTAYRWLHRPADWNDDHGAAVDEPATFPSSAAEPTVVPSRPVPPPPSAPPVIAAAAASTTPPPPPPAPPMAAVSATDPEPSAVDDSKVSIEEELSSLRELVARLAEERRVVVDEALPVAPTAPAPAAPAPAPVPAPLAVVPTPAPSATVPAPPIPSLPSPAEAERDALAVRQAELESELADLRLRHEQTLAQLADDAATAEHSLSEAASLELGLRQQLDAAVAERDRAWRDASVLRIERDQLADRVQVAEQARVDLESELETVSHQWQSVKVELQALADERRAVEQALDDLGAARAAGAAERRALFNDLAAQLGQVEAERDLLAAQVDLMRARILGTRSSLDEATRSLTADVDGAAGAAEAAQAAVAGLDAALGSTHDKLAELDRSIDGVTETSSAPIAPIAPIAPMAPAAPIPPVAPIAAAHVVDVELDDFLPDGAEIGHEIVDIDTDPVDDHDDAPVDEHLDDVPAVPASFGSGTFAPPTFSSDIADEPITPVDALGLGSSADDDRALANVLASYGFGSDDPADDDTDGTAGIAWDTFTDATYGFASDDVVSYGSSADTSTASVDLLAPLESASLDSASLDSGAPDDTEARRIASTADMVMLVDGDAAALMGWRDSEVIDRRGFLLSKLEQVTSEYGPAIDVVFDVSVGAEDRLPTSSIVRPRLARAAAGTADELSDLVDRYPSTWPISVVTDQPQLRAEMEARGIEVLEVVQLLDLIVNLPDDLLPDTF